MKVSCDAKRLAYACGVIRSIKEQSTLPLIRRALLEAQGDKTILYYTNLQTAVAIDLKGRVDEKGACLLNPRRCLQYAKCENGAISISKASEKAKFVEMNSASGKSSIKLKLFESADTVKDYLKVKPNVGELDSLVNMPAGFEQRCRYALQCVALEESRPVLTGVCFNFQEGKLTLASADGFRLVVVDVDVQTTEPYQVIPTAEALRLVAKYMTDKITYSCKKPDTVCFSDKDMTIVSKTVQGTFPQYTQLVPKDNPAWKVYCSAPMLHQRLKQMTMDGSGIIRLSQDGELLKLHSASEEVEEVVAVIPAKSEGEGHIAASINYLIPIASVFSEMTMEVTNPSSPIKVYGDLEGVTFVVMPMFVQW